MVMTSHDYSACFRRVTSPTAYHCWREGAVHAHQLGLSISYGTGQHDPKGELAMRDTWT